MPKFYFSHSRRRGDTVIFQDDEFHHIRNVRRLRPGDCIEAFDDSGISYRLEIKLVKSDRVEARILETHGMTSESGLHITLYQAIPKKQYMDQIIRKGTELGIHVFVPLITRRTIPRWTEQTDSRNIQRWQRIAREASKQCGRSIIPEISRPSGIQEVQQPVDNETVRFVLYEKSDRSVREFLNQHKHLRHVEFAVGPEGGFCPEEIELFAKKSFTSVSLGMRILRTETVAIAVSAVLQYLYGDMGTTIP